MEKLFHIERLNLLQVLFAFNPAVLIMLAVAVFLSAFEFAATSDAGAGQPTLALQVDAGYRARAFCDGLKAVDGIARNFEFYVKNPDGSRSRICFGPWQGSLTVNSPGFYTLKGTDPASGAGYTIIYKQVDASSIELDITFKAPNQSCHLGFDIAKLAGDLFKGSAIEASPVLPSDVTTIPVTPLSVANRMLFMNKNRVLIKSILCDLEIRDLTATGTMLAADIRLVTWDNSKSIYFGSDNNYLNAGGTYSFKYSIRCLPPTIPPAPPVKIPPILKIVSTVKSVSNPWIFYASSAKENTITSGNYQLNPQDKIFGVPTGAAEIVLARELAKLTSMQLAVNPSAAATAGRGIFIERIPGGSAGNLPSEGFEIVTLSDNIVVRGADERGCLYGVYALLARFSTKTGAWSVDCGTIRDWPDLPIRGICMEELAPSIRDVTIVKKYLDAFSRARGNVVIFLHNPPQMRTWLKNLDDGGWTKAQMAELADYARTLQMDVWGGMGSSFNSSAFPELDIRSGSKFYNPFNLTSYQYLFSWYDQILSTYHPSTLLISHDEIMGLSIYAAESGKSTADILAADINKIHDRLALGNVKTAIWSDMLLDFNVWNAKESAANSLNPYFNSGATHLALPQLPKDIMILDWHYGAASDYASVDYFRKNGFSVAGSPWYNPSAAKTLAGSVKTYGGQGIITTDWGFLRTFSPAATTLYAPMCAWSKNCQVDPNNNDVAALADTVRDGIYSERTFVQTPVSLASASNKSTVDLLSGGGIFDIGPILDLRAFPSGKLDQGGFSFDVAPANSGQLNNCVVVGKGDITGGGLPVEKVVFKGSVTAKAVNFLHTCFIEEPQYNLRKLGRYVVEYENGQVVTIDLQENWNITDVRSSEGLRYNDWSFTRSPEVLIGSKPAWKGSSANGIPLNVQMFIWKNPYPGLKITDIRINASAAPVNSRIALLGLTFLQ
jgi:hypothetical protein